MERAHRFRLRRSAALLALLAMLVAALQPIARREAWAAALGADAGTSDRFIGGADGLQPAKMERDGGVRSEKSAAPPPQPAALFDCCALRSPPPRAAAAPPAKAPPGAAKAYQRPDPTGPPRVA